MPLLHCDKCHHEWASALGQKCRWCGGAGYDIGETSLDKFMRMLRVRPNTIENALRMRKRKPSEDE